VPTDPNRKKTEGRYGIQELKARLATGVDNAPQAKYNELLALGDHSKFALVRSSRASAAHGLLG
jgi:hypothetical protein